MDVQDVLYVQVRFCVNKKNAGWKLGMKKIFDKCVAVYLIVSLTLSCGALVYAQDDGWVDYDPSSTYDANPAPATPSYDYGTTPQYDYGTTPSYDYGTTPSYDQPAPSYDYGTTPSYDYGTTPSYDQPPYTPEPLEPLPEPPSYGMEDYSSGATVDASSAGFIKVIKNPRKELSEFQDAIIEGLQVSTEKGATDDEVIVTCYFIFRDKPSSYFYEVNRKERKLTFEFVDARTGSSPVAALEQAPIQEIVIEEDQVDANKEIKGLNPEWHDMIRISFQLEYIPVISVSDESNIISFKYKWTSNSEKITQYIEANRFPLVFWISGGTLGGIGIGVLTYFLIPKKDKVIDPRLDISDLPVRPSNR